MPVRIGWTAGFDGGLPTGRANTGWLIGWAREMKVCFEEEVGDVCGGC